MMNEMVVKFSSRSENESFARVTVASFIAQLNPTLDELNEIKTVVSEVVTNSIIHGYNNATDQQITIRCKINPKGKVELTMSDEGIGIENIDKAREPLYTSKPELERSGMGFTIIENFMDSVEISSQLNKGTTVNMTKQLTTEPTVSKK